MTQTISNQIEIKSAETEEIDFYGDKLKKIFFGSLKEWNNEFNSFKSNAKKSKDQKTFQKHETNFKKYVHNERMDTFLKIYKVFKLAEGKQNSVGRNFLIFINTIIKKAEIKLKRKQVQQY